AGRQVVGAVDDLRRGLQDLTPQTGHPFGEGDDLGAVDVDGATIVATRSPMPAQADRSHAHRMPRDGGGMRRDGPGLPFGTAREDPGLGPIGQEPRQPYRSRGDDARMTVEGLIGEERSHALRDARWAAV